MMKPFTKRLALVMGLLFTALSSLALFETHDKSNLCEVNSEFSGQPAIPIDSRLVKLSDSTYLLPREFGVAVLLAAERDLPALAVPIPVVVRASAQEQMNRVGARAVITRMQDALADWNFAIVDEPRRAMSVTGINCSVSRSVNTGEPSPAVSEVWIVRVDGAVFGNLQPESFLECFGKSFGGCVGDGNCRVHSVSNVIACRASGWFIAARGQLHLESQSMEGFAI